MKPVHILSVVAAMMFVLSLFNKEKGAKILTIFLSLGIAILWVDFDFIQKMGIWLYLISVGTVLIYGIIHLKLPKRDRILIGIIGGFTSAGLLTEINYWAFYNEIKISMIFPILAYIILLNRGLVKKEEFGFLTILFADCLLRFLRLWSF